MIQPIQGEVTLPIQEVFVLSWGGPDEPIKTLERDSVGAWWLRHGGEVVRRASLDEVIKAKAEEGRMRMRWSGR